jgi:hypothetical protein
MKLVVSIAAVLALGTGLAGGILQPWTLRTRGLAAHNHTTWLALGCLVAAAVLGPLSMLVAGYVTGAIAIVGLGAGAVSYGSFRRAARETATPERTALDG